MLLRVRTPQGVQRVETTPSTLLGDLKQRIANDISMPASGVRLSPATSLSELLSPDTVTLEELGLRHGDMIVATTVPGVAPIASTSTGAAAAASTTSTTAATPAAAASTSTGAAAAAAAAAPAKPACKYHGPNGRCVKCLKVLKVNLQEKAHCPLVSFAERAAYGFQDYVRNTLGFAVQRVGLMYGTVGEDRGIRVEAIYEPPQSGTATTATLQADAAEEAAAEALAGELGLRRVGLIVSHNHQDFVLAAHEMLDVAALQQPLGADFVVAVLSLQKSGEGQLEVYQLSDQYRALLVDEPGLLTADAANARIHRAREPLSINFKDTVEVDNGFFLSAVPVASHPGALPGAFPVENRLIAAQPANLKQALGDKQKPFVDAISDFHLLLYISKVLELAVALPLAKAVRSHSKVDEGYEVLIKSAAGLE